MVRIAICDDSEIEQNAVRDIVGTAYDTVVYINGTNLLEDVEEGKKFDILILDIEMPELDGMKLAEKLKPLLPDALILFVSSHEEYVYDSFKVQPYRFVPKIRMNEMLPIAFKDAVKEVKSREGKYYVIQSAKEMCKIPQSSIISIRREGKYALFRLSNGTVISERITLKKLNAQLDNSEFIWAHKGCICNLGQVYQWNGDKLIMKDASEIYISRERKMEVKSRLNRYWGTKEGLEC
jgi:DNA-binding LytR/AlgR family response regulator